MPLDPDGDQAQVETQIWNQLENTTELKKNSETNNRLVNFSFDYQYIPLNKCLASRFIG